MKSQLLSVVLALCAGLTLPAFGVDLGAPSPDRVAMDALTARAAKEGKSVILEVGAAWCGPCTQFAYDLDRHPDDLKALYDSGYIFAKVEAEKVAEGSPLHLTDYLPMINSFFPSVYIYTPATGWKFLGVPSSYQELLSILKGFAGKNPMTLAQMQAYIETLGNKTDDSSDDANYMASSLYGMPDNYSYADAKAILAMLRAENTKFPSQQLGDMADEIQSFSIEHFLGSGAITLATLAQDFPTIAADLTDLSLDDFSNHLFGLTVSYTMRAKGLAAVAQQCPTIWQNTRAVLVKGTLSDADFQTKLAKMELGATVLCGDLDLRANGASDALKQKIAALDQSQISNWHLMAGLGETAAALTIYKAQYKGYADQYAGELAALNTKLQKAKAAGDQKQIDELNAKISVVTFQAQNHASVDADVEAALTAGQPVTALKVLN